MCFCRMIHYRVIADTDKIGEEAAKEVTDPGPADPDEYLRSQVLEDDHYVDGIISQIRKIMRILNCKGDRPVFLFFLRFGLW